MSTVEIVRAESAEQIETAAQLLREYQQWLGFDLGFQGFDEELRTLPGKYAGPGGCLLLALIDGAAAGMIAMRPIDASSCEMKRLFVRSNARGHKLGRRLIAEVMKAAAEAGYSRMRLDTVAGKMENAIALYREFGFREIPSYYETQLPHTLFLEAELRAK